MLDDRIFGLDPQTLFDTAITLIAIFTLFFFLTYLLFKPARELMRKRKEYIQSQLDEAALASKEANTLKNQYDSKIAAVSDEAGEILAKARKNALVKENEIVDDAKDEAARIVARANKEIELNKSKVKDEMKQEMIDVASAMAGKFVENNLDENKQSELIDETLEKMGDDTWQN